MLITAVIWNYIHQNAQSKFVCPSNQLIKDVKIAVGGLNIQVVRDVVAMIHLRRWVTRVQPHTVNAQRSDVVEMLE